MRSERNFQNVYGPYNRVPYFNTVDTLHNPHSSTHVRSCDDIQDATTVGGMSGFSTEGLDVHLWCTSTSCLTTFLLLHSSTLACTHQLCAIYTSTSSFWLCEDVFQPCVLCSRSVSDCFHRAITSLGYNPLFSPVKTYLPIAALWTDLHT